MSKGKNKKQHEDIKNDSVEENINRLDNEDFRGEKGGLSEGTVIIDEKITFIPDITTIEELEDEEYKPEE